VVYISGLAYHNTPFFKATFRVAFGLSSGRVQNQLASNRWDFELEKILEIGTNPDLVEIHRKNPPLGLDRLS
jgi:hypothetical protein